MECALFYSLGMKSIDIRTKGGHGNQYNENHKSCQGDEMCKFGGKLTC